MADVQFTIGADQAPFKASLAGVQETVTQTGHKIAAMGESLGIEGLKGERKIHKQLEGFITDIGSVQSAGDLAGQALMRMASITRMAIPFMVAFVAITEGFKILAETITAGNERLDKFHDTMKRINETDILDTPAEELKAFRKELQDYEKEYEKRSWLSRVIFGGREDIAIQTARDRIASLSRDIAQQTQESIEADTQARFGSSKEDRMQGEIQKTRNEYAQKIAKAEKDFKDNGVGRGVIDALKEQEEAAVKEIWDKYRDEQAKASNAAEKADREQIQKIADLEKQAEQEKEDRRDTTLDRQLDRIRRRIGETEAKLADTHKPEEKARVALELEKLRTQEVRKQEEIRQRAAREAEEDARAAEERARKKAAAAEKEHQQATHKAEADETLIQASLVEAQAREKAATTEEERAAARLEVERIAAELAAARVAAADLILEKEERRLALAKLLVDAENERAKADKDLRDADTRAAASHTSLSLLAGQLRLRGALGSINASGRTNEGDAIAARRHDENMRHAKRTADAVEALKKKLNIL